MYRMVGHGGDVTALRKSSPAVTDRATLHRAIVRLDLIDACPDLSPGARSAWAVMYAGNDDGDESTPPAAWLGPGHSRL